MKFEITDRSGRSRTFLDWGTAAAKAAGRVKVTDAAGRTVVVDPAMVGAK
ncbi:hypothetical protein [Actinacidiphila glaucinigra]